MNHGLKIIPSSMRKNTEACRKTRKRRALAIDKNLRPRYKRNWINRLRNQVAVFCSAARHFYRHGLEGRLYGEERGIHDKDLCGEDNNGAREECS
jgi:hypothetical protein